MDLILDRIHRSSIRLLSPLDTPVTYKRVVEEAKHLLHAEYATILLARDGELHRVYANSPVIANTSVKKNGRTYQAFTKGRPFIVQVNTPRDINAQQFLLGIKSITFIPLSYKNETIGVLNILSQSRHLLSSNDLKALQLFGTIAYFSIKRSQTYENVRQSLQQRNLFISLAAHEIKNPLTALYNYLQLMQMTYSSKLPFEEEWIMNSLDQTKLAINLVEEFLDVEKSENARLQIYNQKIFLQKVIYQAIASFKITHQDRLVIFKDKTHSDNCIKGQESKLLQAFINILNNASKFSPPKSNIIVELKKSSYLEVSITDYGKGISKQELIKVFDKFYQGKNNTLKEGRGLGLFITKDIIEKHHGKITITSKINKGTTVKIFLPIN